MQNLTGQTIDRYHILEQIGEGGMAVVYKAYDTRLEREVAIKIIRKEAFPPEALDRIFKRFEREAKSLARLSHPNIIKVHDYGEYEGSPYLVMEYQPGGTLKAMLGTPLPWNKVSKYIIPLAEALGYAHQQGILHRDVKPSNILITTQGEPMLTDFGIAKILDMSEGQTLTGTGIGVGTPEYMAPEQGLGKDVDGRVDVYSLGVILYELTTGRKPYTADTPMAVLFKHMTDPLPRPGEVIPGIPDDLEKVILKCLAKDPANRYQSMAELVSAMELVSDLEGRRYNRKDLLQKPAIFMREGETTDSVQTDTDIDSAMQSPELIYRPDRKTKFHDKSSHSDQMFKWWLLVLGGTILIILCLLLKIGNILTFPSSEISNTSNAIMELKSTKDPRPTLTNVPMQIISPEAIMSPISTIPSPIVLTTKTEIETGRSHLEDLPLIYYIEGENGEKRIIASTILGENKKIIYSTVQNISGLTLSPDRKFLAFVSELGASSKIIIVNLEDNNQILTLGDGRNNYPSCWIDNSTLVYSSDKDIHIPDLYEINIDDSSDTRITENGAIEYDIACRSTRQKLFFAINDNGYYVVDFVSSLPSPKMVLSEKKGWVGYSLSNDQKFLIRFQTNYLNYAYLYDLENGSEEDIKDLIGSYCGYEETVIQFIENDPENNIICSTSNSIYSFNLKTRQGNLIYKTNSEGRLYLRYYKISNDYYAIYDWDYSDRKWRTQIFGVGNNEPFMIFDSHILIPDTVQF